MIKKQVYINDINKDDESFMSFDILLTTNINDIGVKEPYVYPEWVAGGEVYQNGDGYEGEGDIVMHGNKNGDGGDIVLYNNKHENSPDIVMYGNKIYKCAISHRSGDVFDIGKWEEIDTDTATKTVEYIGESRIDEFKRYGKTINDSDLYNTEYPINEGGIIKKIIATKDKIDPFSKQAVYEYTFTDPNGNVTTYDDTGDGSSIISYTAKGLNEDNAINLPSFKNEELLGVIGKPKVEVDVFIDRGINNSFDKHIKISEIKTLEALEKYGNGFFKIKE